MRACSPARSGRCSRCSPSSAAFSPSPFWPRFSGGRPEISLRLDLPAPRSARCAAPAHSSPPASRRPTSVAQRPLGASGRATRHGFHRPDRPRRVGMALRTVERLRAFPSRHGQRSLRDRVESPRRARPRRAGASSSRATARPASTRRLRRGRQASLAGRNPPRRPRPRDALGLIASPTRGGQTGSPMRPRRRPRVDSRPPMARRWPAAATGSLHIAARSGFRTAAVIPTITMDWPESAAIGFDTVLAAAVSGIAASPSTGSRCPTGPRSKPSTASCAARPIHALSSRRLPRPSPRPLGPSPRTARLGQPGRRRGLRRDGDLRRQPRNRLARP